MTDDVVVIVAPVGCFATVGVVAIFAAGEGLDVVVGRDGRGLMLVVTGLTVEGGFIAADAPTEEGLTVGAEAEEAGDGNAVEVLIGEEEDEGDGTEDVAGVGDG